MGPSLDELYAVLDLKPGASEDEVRAARLLMLKVWHPDRYQHDPPLRERAEAKTKQINEAFQALERAGFPRASEKARSEADENAHRGHAPPNAHAGGDQQEPHRQQEHSTADSETSQPAAGQPPSGQGTAPSGPQHAPQNAPGVDLRWALLAIPILGAIVIAATRESRSAEDSASSYSSYTRSRDYHAPTSPSTTVRPELPVSEQRTYSVGSSEDEVAAIEGTPDRVTNLSRSEKWWFFQGSRIDFRKGKVVAWQMGYPRRLNVSMTPRDAAIATAARNRGFFVVGSSEDEVIGVEGTPDHISLLTGSDKWWHYEGSRVEFRDGKVTAWDSNLRRPLKVRVGEKPLPAPPPQHATRTRAVRAGVASAVRVSSQQLRDLSGVRREIRRIVKACTRTAKTGAFVKLSVYASGALGMAWSDNECVENSVKKLEFPVTERGFNIDEHVGEKRSPASHPQDAAGARAEGAGLASVSVPSRRLRDSEEVRAQIRRIVAACTKRAKSGAYIKLSVYPSGTLGMVWSDNECVENSAKKLVFPATEQDFSMNEQVTP